MTGRRKLGGSNALKLANFDFPSGMLPPQENQLLTKITILKMVMSPTNVRSTTFKNRVWTGPSGCGFSTVTSHHVVVLNVRMSHDKKIVCFVKAKNSSVKKPQLFRREFGLRLFVIFLLFTTASVMSR